MSAFSSGLRAVSYARNKSILTGAVLGTGFTLAAAFAAQAATITNGSFELGTAPGAFLPVNSPDNGATITGWNVTGGSVDYIGSYWAASDGSRSLDMNGTSAGTIQTTITGLLSGVTYRVLFDIAGNTDGGPTDKVLDAFSASTGNNFFHFNITGHSRDTAATMGWVTESFVFTASSDTELLTFASHVNSGGTTENPAAFGPALRIEATPLPAFAAVVCQRARRIGLGLAAQKEKVGLSPLSGSDLARARHLIDARGTRDI
jgi:choice-of-anchor C domain-containing protein